jgi:hypothetical protein
MNPQKGTLLFHFSASGKRRRESSNDNDDDVEKTKKIIKTDQDAPSDQPELGSLLDLTSLTTADEISRRFDDIADALFFRYRLCLGCGDGVSPTEFDLLEFEFYLKKPGCHEDPFTHGSEEQKQSGRWFVLLQYPHQPMFFSRF